MNEAEADLRLRMLEPAHMLATWLLTSDGCAPDTPAGRQIRRWVQRVKLRVIDDLDPNDYELWTACQKAVDQAFHPEKHAGSVGLGVVTRGPT